MNLAQAQTVRENSVTAPRNELALALEVFAQELDAEYAHTREAIRVRANDEDRA